MRTVPPRLMVKHFMTTIQLNVLFNVFARPIWNNGIVEIRPPAWWYLAYATATR